jgi:hypothetical protein
MMYWQRLHALLPVKPGDKMCVRLLRVTSREAGLIFALTDHVRELLLWRVLSCRVVWGQGRGVGAPDGMDKSENSGILKMVFLELSSCVEPNPDAVACVSCRFSVMHFSNVFAECKV